MRRLLIVLSVSAFLLATASSALADTSPPPDESGTYHFRSSGGSAAASFSNVPSDGDVLPPGAYFSTDIWASESITTQGGDVFEDSGVCVFHWTFTITNIGDYVDGPSLDGCVSAAELTISRRLAGAGIVGAVPVGRCLDYDEDTGDCLDFVDLGTVMVDLDLSGVGQTVRYHGASSGGSAGNYQFTYHSAGSERRATVSGSVDLVAPDGSIEDLTGGVAGGGYLSQSREGSTDVFISSGRP